ncbi:MAG: undecaprenyl-diphosphate phosphatase [Ignavibacteriales bacterium]|nr:undecaprenyl-diphosphate phosphatase [Ignavibacteriales bacterium]
MTFLQAVLLGIVQGFTEFLPVSSSGHLVLAQELLDVQSVNNLTFDVFVHFGTLVSVLVYFWKDALEIIKSMGKSFRPANFREGYAKDEHLRLGVAIVIGTIPAGVIGLLFHEAIKDTFTEPKLVGVNLVLTGLILFLTRLSHAKEGKQVGALSGFVIGIAQAIAILPGISRAGTTISTGLYLRLSHIQAARFSFLLSVPAIAGASILETRSLLQGGIDIGIDVIAVGTVVAAVSGYLSIKAMLKVLQKRKISWFALYCLVVGVIGIVFI